MNVLKQVALLLAAFAACAGLPHSHAADESAHEFPVLSRPARPGDAITDDMLIERRLVANATARRAYATDRESLVGKIALRPIAAGVAIANSAVGPPFVFKEGERVSFEFKSGGLQISGIGVALHNGVLGQSAKVRNLDTGVIVTGIVGASGVVEVGG